MAVEISVSVDKIVPAILSFDFGAFSVVDIRIGPGKTMLHMIRLREPE